MDRCSGSQQGGGSANEDVSPVSREHKPRQRWGLDLAAHSCSLATAQLL